MRLSRIDEAFARTEAGAATVNPMERTIAKIPNNVASEGLSSGMNSQLSTAPNEGMRNFHREITEILAFASATIRNHNETAVAVMKAKKSTLPARGKENGA